MDQRELLNLTAPKLVGKNSLYNYKEIDNSQVRKAVDYFYLNHPVKNIVRNKAKDTLTIKRVFEYAEYTQILIGIKYLHYLRKTELTSLSYFLNEAVQIYNYKKDSKNKNTPGWYLDYFYSLRS